MKRGITLFIVAVLLFLVPFLVYGIKKNNDETLWEQRQMFDKPIIVKDSQEGVWKGGPNIGLQDSKNYFLFYDEFITQSASGTADGSIWFTSDGMTLQDDAPGGEAWLISVGDSNVNAQVNGESFRLTGENNIWYETRFNVPNVDEAGWFVGLAITDTTILAGVTDRIGFESAPTDSASIYFVTEQDEYYYTVDTGVDVVDATMIRLGFIADGGYTTQTITAYVDDMGIEISNTMVPHDTALTPTYEFAVAQTSHSMELDYIRVIQER